MRKAILAATLTTIGLVGCVGGIESGGGSDPLESPDGDGNDNGDNPAGEDLTAAKQLFDTNVYPIIQRCSGGACHSETATSATLTRFVGSDVSRGWQVAVGFQALVGNFTPTAAPILTYIQGRNHQGMADWSSPEVAKISDWLTKEVELRNGQTTPTPPGSETITQASERVLKEFNGCMTIEDFAATNMAAAWANTGSDEGNCEQCHETGESGFIASEIGTRAFDVLTTRKYFFLQYLTPDLTMGAAGAKIVVNETSFRGVSNGQDPHREHPRFNATNNQGMTALRALYDRVMAKKAAGTCAPPEAFTM